MDKRYRSSWDARSIAHVLGVGHTTVAGILREARGPRPQRVLPSHERRTWFLRRDVMWSSDYVDVGNGKLHKTLDEMARFRLGWEIVKSETAAGAVKHAQQTIERMGRSPLVWKFDNGSAYASKDFQGFLAENRIVPYAIPPRSPWVNGRTERDNKEVRNWLIPLENMALPVDQLERDVDDGMLMLNYVKPRWVLGYRTSAAVYFGTPGVEDLDRERFIAELVELRNQFGESRWSGRLHRKAVRMLMQKWGLYEESFEARVVNRLEADRVAV